MDAAHRDNYAANGGDSNRTKFWRSLKNIHRAATDCPPVLVALDAYFQEITRRGLLSVHRGREKSASPAQYTFITDLVRNLILYGWSAYRQIRAADNDKDIFYQVPDGSDVAIKFDQKKKQWVADKRNASLMGSFAPEDDDVEFDLVVLQPPNESSAVSFGQRAVKEVDRLLHFEQCQRERELHNSRRECYVYVDNNAIATTSGGIPWLQSSIPSASALGNTDYESLISNRVNMLKAFRETSQARKREQGTGGRVGSGLPSVQTTTQQHEYTITDGHRPAEARHLLGNGNDNDLLRMLVYRVWEAMGVPPSALGHVPNKERASGAERATGSALDGFRTTSMHISNVLQPALLRAGLTMGRKVRVEILKEIFPMLKTEAAIDLMSTVFDVRTDMFDADAVKEMQVSKRAATGQTKRAGPDGDEDEDKGSKVQKTQLEQDVSVANKAGL